MAGASSSSAITANPAQGFNTFHGRTQGVPFEITRKIIEMVEPCDVLLGEPGVVLPAITQVSSAFRNAYLSLHSRFDFEPKHARKLPFGRPPSGQKKPKTTNPTIGETLNFPDLESLAKYFTHGPGRPMTPQLNLQHVTFVRVEYRDSCDLDWWTEHSEDFAYEAFLLLANNQWRMGLQRVQLVWRSSESPTLDTPGFWHLLKLRGLRGFILTARSGVVRRDVRAALDRRTSWSTRRPWRPVGIEAPGPTPGNTWTQLVPHNPLHRIQDDQAQWLEERYKWLHDRREKAARAAEARIRLRRRWGVSSMCRKKRARRQYMQRMDRLRKMKAIRRRLNISEGMLRLKMQR
jgi:hypothetical protein